MVGKKLLLTAAIAAGLASAATAKANVEINSFENSLGGFVYPASSGDTAYTISGYSTTTGVTDGTYSAVFSPSATNTGTGPSYQQFIESPGYSVALTDELVGATAITLDVFAPAGSFGGYIQFNAAIQAQPGYNYDEIGGFDAAHTPTFGTESTITFALTAAAQADIATAYADGVGTQFSISIGGGYTAGNDTAYLDNLQAVTPTVATPEPASLGLLGLAVPALLRRRRQA